MKEVETWITLGWAALLLSCLLSMMAVFMGSTSSDLRGLVDVQATLLPVAVIGIAYYLWKARRIAEDSRGAALLWRHTPAWLVVAVACAASLTLVAELTFVLLHVLDAGPRQWREHVPAIGALLSAVALALGFASLSLPRGAGDEG